MSAIDKQIQIALATTLAASKLSPSAYSLARQVGLFQWLANKTRRFGSVGQEIIMSPEFLHREYWHSYDVPLAGRNTVFQVWIVQTGLLAKEHLFGRGVVSDPKRPNLYVAQQSGMQRRVILEVDADETAVLHAIIRQKSQQHFWPIQDLTDDADLQEQVNLIFGNIVARIEKHNMPYTTAVDDMPDNAIYLPFPVPESEAYPQKLKWLLERSDLIEVTNEIDDEPMIPYEPTWKPLQKGDVARRLRELGMIKEIGSIRGVYDEIADSETTSRWQKLDILERAGHEQRIVGCGTLPLHEDMLRMVVIMRDRLNDGIGQHFLLRRGKKQWLITIDLNGENESIMRYKHDIMTYFDTVDTKTLSSDDLETACETWEDGLRVDAWLKVLFDVVEQQQGYVSSETVMRTLQKWLGIEEESEETTS